MMISMMLINLWANRIEEQESRESTYRQIYNRWNSADEAEAQKSRCRSGSRGWAQRPGRRWRQMPAPRPRRRSLCLRSSRFWSRNVP